MTFEPNALFIKEEMEPDDIVGKTVLSAALTNISYVGTKINPNITLDSMQYSYITDAQRELIISMYKDIGQTYDIEYLEGGTQEVSFRYDEPPKFTESYEGSCLFKGIIYLIKN